MKTTAHTPFQPPLAGPSEKDVAAAKAVLAAHEDAKKQQAGDTLIECAATGYVTNKKTACGEMFRIRDAVAIQTHFYISPRGCTEGDYWKCGEVRLVCPNCGRELRLYDSPEVENLTLEHAKSVEHKYGDG